MAQSRNFVFTINNWNENHLDLLEKLEAEYIIAGKEVSPTTKTPHLQGFVRFKSNKRVLTVRKLLAPHHVEVCVGGAKKAIQYCRKEDSTPFEFGTPPKTQGSGNAERWTLAKEALLDGRIEDVDPEIFIKYYAACKNIMKDHMKKPEAIQGTCGLWIHGDTGTGKSHSVITQHPDRYIKPLNKWWDGYQNEVVVHLDELAPSHAQWIAPYLKKWADKWPFDAETKGSSIQIRPELVVVTSNYALCDMGFSQEDLPALERRFRVVEKKRDQDIHVTK